MKRLLCVIALASFAFAAQNGFDQNLHVSLTKTQYLSSGDTAIVNTYTHDTYGHSANYKRVAVIHASIGRHQYDLEGRALLPIGDYKAKVVTGKHREIQILTDGKVEKYAITGESEIDPNDPLGIR